MRVIYYKFGSKLFGQAVSFMFHLLPLFSVLYIHWDGGGGGGVSGVLKLRF